VVQRCPDTDFDRRFEFGDCNLARHRSPRSRRRDTAASSALLTFRFALGLSREAPSLRVLRQMLPSPCPDTMGGGAAVASTLARREPCPVGPRLGRVFLASFPVRCITCECRKTPEVDSGAASAGADARVAIPARTDRLNIRCSAGVRPSCSGSRGGTSPRRRTVFRLIIERYGVLQGRAKPQPPLG
jgi:hypothetical protein